MGGLSPPSSLHESPLVTFRRRLTRQAAVVLLATFQTPRASLVSHRGHELALSHEVSRGARHSFPETSTPPARRRRDFTPSTRFSKTSCFRDRPCRSSRPSRHASRSGRRTGCGRGLRFNVLRRVAAASRVTPCPARGFGTLASVRRRRRRPFEIKGLLLMLHHLWCAATLAKGVCPTSELRLAMNTASLSVVATRTAWPATAAAMPKNV